MHYEASKRSPLNYKDLIQKYEDHSIYTFLKMCVSVYLFLYWQTKIISSRNWAKLYKYNSTYFLTFNAVNPSHTVINHGYTVQSASSW